MDDLHDKLSEFRIRRELSSCSAASRIGKLHELSGKYPPMELRGLLRRWQRFLDAPLSFGAGEEWVETESNVRFRVVERHCERFAIDFEAIKSQFTDPASLHQLLEAFVDERNDIAHGAQFRPITQAEWEAYKLFVLKLIQLSQFELYETISGGKGLLKSVPPRQDFEI